MPILNEYQCENKHKFVAFPGQFIVVPACRECGGGMVQANQIYRCYTCSAEVTHKYPVVPDGWIQLSLAMLKFIRRTDALGNKSTGGFKTMERPDGATTDDGLPIPYNEVFCSDGHSADFLLAYSLYIRNKEINPPLTSKPLERAEPMPLRELGK